VLVFPSERTSRVLPERGQRGLTSSASLSRAAAPAQQRRRPDLRRRPFHRQGINTVNCRGLELLRHPVEQTRSKVGNKYFILGRTSHLAMEAKFFRFLKLVGVGFKARTEREGRELFLKLGYSHEVQFTAPPAVRVFCFKPNIICCTGIDKHRVHHFAGAVRCSKPPEVYKGKGILYIDEVIKLKPGKKQQKK
uniref:Large ribosomal subunit protein uL6 alpha-beta domain-containing protein n=1 Tax=Aegilops tauschii subsp. strangulata TaxID=200361 RepID=A0A453PJC9_AEGTS